MPMASTTICLQTSSEHVLLLVLQYLSTNSHISLRDLTLARLPKMMVKRSSFYIYLHSSFSSLLRASNPCSVDDLENIRGDPQTGVCLASCRNANFCDGNR